MQHSFNLKKLYQEGLVWFAEDLCLQGSSQTKEQRPHCFLSSPSDSIVNSESKEIPESSLPGKLLKNSKLQKLKNLHGTETQISFNDQNNFSAPFGITEIDQILSSGGLPSGSFHEIFPLPALLNSKQTSRIQPYPPCLLLSLLSGNAVKNLVTNEILQDNYKKELFFQNKFRPAALEKLIIWIGKEIWPNPFLLNQTVNFSLNSSSLFAHTANTIKYINLMRNCLFIDPPNEKLHLWCTENALRSPAVAVTISSFKKLSFPISRKLALIAKQNGSLGLFVGNYKQINSPGFAATKWSIRPEESDSENPKWTLRLIRYRGKQLPVNSWQIEQMQRGSNERQQIYLALSSNLGNRSSQDRFSERTTAQHQYG